MLADRRCADCKYVIARRMSPPEVLIKAETTAGSSGTCSAVAISSKRADVEESERGVKRNFEHLEARGSMILFRLVGEEVGANPDINCAPGDIVAHKAETSDPRICLHDAPQRALSVLCHGVCFVQNDNLVRRTRICLSIRRYCLRTRSLPGEVLDLFANDADTSLIGGVEFEHSISEIVWPTKSAGTQIGVCARVVLTQIVDEIALGSSMFYPSQAGHRTAYGEAAGIRTSVSAQWRLSSYCIHL